MITALPDVLRACLSEAADCADPLTDGELEEFLDTHQGEGCGYDNCRNAIAGPVTKFETKVEDNAGRHDTLVEVAPWAMSEAMGGVLQRPRSVRPALRGILGQVR